MFSETFAKSSSSSSHHAASKRGRSWLGAFSILFFTVIALFAWVPEAAAYQAYSERTDDTLCGACHGTFAGGTYTSNKDGVSWGENLHNGHRTTMLAGDCNTCHGGVGTSGREVNLASSSGGNGLDPLACAGCHGRAEDVNADNPNTSGTGIGAGLRQQHYIANRDIVTPGGTVNTTVCAGCHEDADPAGYTPVAENVPPPYYFTPDAIHLAKPTDACDANGSESVFGSTGLDNDGDGLIDGDDAACGPPANVAPVAVDDSYSTTEDAPLTVAAALGVLDNDTDADADSLTAVLDTDVANGTLSLAANGSFTYTPNANFNGSDSFTYFANDGTVNSAIAATVTITVTPVIDPPVAADDSYTTDEDTPLNVAAPGVLGNDTDADGDPLTALLVVGTSDGALTLNADGSFDYTPDADFNGSDSFTYRANDGTVSSTLATVTITVTPVNDSPVANDDAASTPFETAATIDVLANDTDADSLPSPLAVASVTQGTNGAVVNNGGNVTYTPATGFSGVDSFTYIATDGADPSNSATVTVTVGAADNVPPVANAGGPYSGTAGVALTLNGSLSDDSDGTIASYAWDFDDGDTGSGVSPSHTYAAAGTYTVSLIVTDNDGASSLPDTATATIDVAPADILVSPLALVFGPVTVGQTGTQMTSISNVGGADLEVTGFGFVGSTDFDLSPLAPTPPFTIAAGDPPVDVQVDYTPGEEGGDSGTLQIASDDSDTSMVSVALSGLGVAPALECDIDVGPLVLDFGPVEMGITGTATTFVSNTGTADCTVDALEFPSGSSPDFALGAGVPSLSFTVVAGGPAVGVPVDYTPFDVGDDSGVLSIGSDDIDEPFVDVSLAGSGVAPSFLDLDIAGFRVTKRVKLARVKQVGITLTVKNDGDINSQTRPATVIGMQNGGEVYSETLAVSDAVGNGRSKFPFPPYTPDAPGDITWTVTIADDDPDVDMATATTKVVD